MGRCYHGDIDGMFMFGAQSSIAADRFGSTHSKPNYVEYYFDEDQLQTIKDELVKLKPNHDLVEAFFRALKKRTGSTSYSDTDMKKKGITTQMMSDYADYTLGIKIKRCIEKYGDCSFSAEL